MAKPPAVSTATAWITVNGGRRAVVPGTGVVELLAELGLRPGSAVVELNGVALVPSELGDAVLADGDTVEIVRAVAGG